MFYYIVGAYVLGIFIFYTVSPLFYKHWGWTIHDSNNHPPPEITSLAWPAILAVYAFYYVVGLLLLGKILTAPFRLLKKWHLAIGNYITYDSIQRRKHEREDKKAKKLVAPKDSLSIAAEEIAADEWERKVLAYREANCKGCGQSLNKTA